MASLNRPNSSGLQSLIWKSASLLLYVNLGACGTGHLARDSMLEPDESLVVIGVNPTDTVGLYVFPGDVRGGKLNISAFSNAVISGKGQDGYLVSKAKAGQTLGIVNFFVYGEGVFVGKPYSACGDQKVVTFEVPAGKAIYLADFEYSTSSGRLSARVKENFSQASAFVNEHYPQFNGKLQQASYEWMPTSRNCGGGVTFIYLPVK